MNNIKRKNFKSDYAVHPGLILDENLELIGLSQKEFALRADITEKHVSQIINGKASITPETAIKLERVVGGTVSFWNNLECRYKEDLARIKEDVKIQRESKIVEKHFKVYNELANKNYVPKTKDYTEKAKNLLHFLRVDSLNLTKKIEAVAFKKVKSLNIDEHALACWLRAGEVEASKVNVLSYNKRKLKSCIKKMRKLTLKSDFWCALTELCAECGVILVYVPAFKNTKVNGAFRWINDNPMIQMTIYNKYSDIFWFAFFHEIGHILLHGKKDQFYDVFGDHYHIDFKKQKNNEKENQANEFASEVLIPMKKYKIFIKAADFSNTSIINFAKKIGVSPGVLAGRLAHDESVESFSWRNASSLRTKLTVK
jgi:HTH-type transcriptional regulator/antitoxin HigA